MSRVLTTSLDRDGQAGSRFRVWGSRFGVPGLLFFVFCLGGVWDMVLGFRVQGVGFRMSTFEVQGSGLGFRVQAS